MPSHSQRASALPPGWLKSVWTLQVHSCCRCSCWWSMSVSSLWLPMSFHAQPHFLNFTTTSMLREQRAQRKIHTGLFGSVSVKFDWGNTSLSFAVALRRRGVWEEYIGKDLQGSLEIYSCKGTIDKPGLSNIYTLFHQLVILKIFNLMSFRCQVAILWSSLCLPFCDYLSCLLISGSNPIVFYLQKVSRSTSVEAFLQTQRPLCFLYLAW